MSYYIPESPLLGLVSVDANGTGVPRLNDAARTKKKTEVINFIRTMAEI